MFIIRAYTYWNIILILHEQFWPFAARALDTLLLQAKHTDAYYLAMYKMPVE